MVTADYVVGLTDGEGCFYVWVRPLGVSRAVLRPVHVHYYLKMHEKEKHLLDEVKRFFGCGAVYFQKERRKNHSACYRFEINRYEDVLKVVIPFFEKHPLHSRKRKDFAIFKKIVELIANGDHLTEGGLEKIRSLKLQMNLGGRRVREIRPHGGNVK